MIDVSFQGKGYGLFVIKEIINYFRENNANVITLSTKESNARALSLYRKLYSRYMVNDKRWKYNSYYCFEW